MTEAPNNEQRIIHAYVIYFIAQMPLLDHTFLTTDRQRRLAHMILTFIASGYVWQNGAAAAAQVKNS